MTVRTGNKPRDELIERGAARASGRIRSVIRREGGVVADATGRLGLGQLQRLAAAFDAISDESGARYSAASFAEWVRREIDGPASRREARRLDSQVDSLARR
jgi:hypothetical protein